MPRAKTQSALITYRVKKGKEAEFVPLLESHWPALRMLRLVIDEPPLYFRGEDDGKPYFVEIFTWKDAASKERAHQSGEAASIWESMQALCEEAAGVRDVEPITLVHART